ncbi:hypothetical protein FNV43_RR04318 [Rhamnella rubrinervis]|uniref:Uncharacterized protein n=1 Tax=Rhamnella rubrinervis TaxID=2594499 RepID=A0A8K0MPN8_9ROSA|nr:hypothetical protein FNV43_RR04318 [Rhamnella rubrinervis]
MPGDKNQRLGRTLQRPQAFSARMTHAKWVINAFVSKDLYYPHPLVQDILWASLHKGVESILMRWPGKKLREKALRTAMEHIHYEDENTHYICIGPVNKAVFISVWLLAVICRSKQVPQKILKSRIPSYNAKMSTIRFEVGLFDGKGDFDGYQKKLRFLLSHHKVAYALEADTSKWPTNKLARKSEIDEEAFIFPHLGDNVI